MKNIQDVKVGDRVVALRKIEEGWQEVQTDDTVVHAKLTYAQPGTEGTVVGRYPGHLPTVTWDLTGLTCDAEAGVEFEVIGRRTLVAGFAGAIPVERLS